MVIVPHLEVAEDLQWLMDYVSTQNAQQFKEKLVPFPSALKVACMIHVS